MLAFDAQTRAVARDRTTSGDDSATTGGRSQTAASRSVLSHAHSIGVGVDVFSETIVAFDNVQQDASRQARLRGGRAPALSFDSGSWATTSSSASSSGVARGRLELSANGTGIVVCPAPPTAVKVTVMVDLDGGDSIVAPRDEYTSFDMTTPRGRADLWSLQVDELERCCLDHVRSDFDTAPTGCLTIDPWAAGAPTTLADISRAFTLNCKQHAAFVIVGRSFILSLRNGLVRMREADNDLAMLETMSSWEPDAAANGQRVAAFAPFSDNPARLFLRGPAGSGKSQIFAALEFLGERFQHSKASPQRTACFAFTGKAALNVRGTTIHGGLSLGRKEGDALSATALRALRTRFAGLAMVTIDELGLVDKDLFGRIDERLRLVRDVPDKPFGGLTVLAAGDFNQLPPVRGSMLYIKPPPGTQLAGWTAYRELTSVVELTHIFRQQDDPVFRDLCQSLANKDVGDDEVRLLQSRCLDAQSSLQLPRRFDVPIATIGNASRNSINEAINVKFLNAVVDRASSRGGRLPVVFRLIGRPSGHEALTSSERRQYLWSVPDVKFGVPPFIDVTYGSRVVVTRSQYISIDYHQSGTTARVSDDAFADMFPSQRHLCAANGSEAFVVGVGFEPGTEFSVISHSVIADDDDPSQSSSMGRRYDIHVPTKQATTLFLYVPGAPFPRITHSVMDGVGRTVDVRLPQNVLPLRPLAPTTVRQRIQRRTMSLEATLRLANFPVTLPFAQTLTKLQGLTTDDLIVSEVYTDEPYLSKVNHHAMLYLVVSRCRRLDNVFFTFPITRPFLDKFLVRDDVYMAEDARLRALEAMTLASFPEPNVQQPSSNATDLGTTGGRRGPLVRQLRGGGHGRPGRGPRRPQQQGQGLFFEGPSSGAWYGHDVTTWPPSSTTGATFSWLFMPLLCDVLLPHDVVAFPALPRPLTLYVGVDFCPEGFVRYKTILDGYRDVFARRDVDARALVDHADGLWHVPAQQQEELLSLGASSLCPGTSLSLWLIVELVGQRLAPDGVVYRPIYD